MTRKYFAFFLAGALTLGGCAGDTGDPGTAGTPGDDGIAGTDGTDGTTGTDGTDGTDGTAGTDGFGVDWFNPPGLSGHQQRGNLLAYDVQAAFNDDTFFWRVSYRGNEGKRHQYLHYTNGAWQMEGSPRRDSQATLDNDPVQGDLGATATIYEQRTSIMVSDPNNTPYVTDFDKFGCFMTCHDQNRNMPEWDTSADHDTKWVEPAHVTGYAAGTADKVLDLWHWRGARSNPIAKADDQYIHARTFTNTVDNDDGGRKGDSGSGPFTTNRTTNGNPNFVFDPTTTWGGFAMTWDNFWLTPFYYFTDTTAQFLGATTPNPQTMAWDDAVAAGYVPTEGDWVPRRILRAGAGSRSDINSFGTEFVPQSADGSLGVWHVQMQRALDTGNDDDVAFVAGNTYDVGFEVHLWEYTARDHYVSFPMSMSLGAGGDIEAVDLRGNAGTYPLPNWNDTAAFPVNRLYLFMPGITTWEFLTGADAGKTFMDPVTGLAVDQVHVGSGAVNAGSSSCIDCHRVREIDDGGLIGGSMETLSGQRGGIWADTPYLVP